MNSIMINLPDDYTVEQAYLDAALATGWTASIEVSEVDTSVEPHTLRTVVIPNPVSAQDQGQAVWLSVINERLVTTRLAAEAIKLQSFTAGLAKGA